MRTVCGTAICLTCGMAVSRYEVVYPEVEYGLFRGPIRVDVEPCGHHEGVKITSLAP